MFHQKSLHKTFDESQDEWVGTLLWRSCQSPVAHRYSLLNHLNSFCGQMSKLNVKFDVDSLFYSFSHFEFDGHTVHMLTQQHLPSPLASTVKLSLFTHAHSSPLSLAVRLHWCCANHSHYINNGCTFSRQSSFIYMWAEWHVWIVDISLTAWWRLDQWSRHEIIDHWSSLGKLTWTNCYHGHVENWSNLRCILEGKIKRFSDRLGASVVRIRKYSRLNFNFWVWATAVPFTEMKKAWESRKYILGKNLQFCLTCVKDEMHVGEPSEKWRRQLDLGI